MRASEFSEGVLDGIKGYFRDKKDFPAFRDPERTRLLARMKAGVPAPADHSERIKGIRQRAELDAAATYKITSSQGTTEHDLEDARKMVKWLRKHGIEYTVVKEVPTAVEEDLGPEQKKVAVGKLVGC
jgi:hypothetical protein